MKFKMTKNLYMKKIGEKAKIASLHLSNTNIKKRNSVLIQFNKYLKVDGIIITKLDGTAKGGVALTAISDYNIPVYFIGVGEGSDDLVPFVPEDYLNAIMGEDDEQ